MIITGLLLIAPRLFKREVELEFLLPQESERLHIQVVQDDAIFRGIEVDLSDKVSLHREQLSLLPGKYRIQATLSLPGGPHRIEKVVELPEDSPVEIRF